MISNFLFPINIKKDMMKYLLSSGRATDKIEEYIIDTFKLYLKVYPGDIPGATKLGFDFNLGDTRKADIPNAVSSMASELIKVIGDRFKGGINMTLDSIEIIDETKAKLVVSVNNKETETVEINLYDE